ncbi:3'-5' exonuclease [Mycolicibacterium brisbanense]
MRNLLSLKNFGHGDRSGSRSWRDDELWAVDLETTGLNLRSDKIISYGAIPIHHGRILMARATYGLVHIAEAVPAPSACIHGIRTQDLAAAPPIKDAVAQLHTLIGDRPIIAHCAVIERTLLRRAYRGCGRRLTNRFIDTAPLAARALGVSITEGAISLEYAATKIGVPVHTPHHALGDAVTTANLFLALASRLEQQLGTLSTAALIEISTKQKQST